MGAGTPRTFLTSGWPSSEARGRNGTYTLWRSRAQGPWVLGPRAGGWLWEHLV